MVILVVTQELAEYCRKITVARRRFTIITDIIKAYLVLACVKQNARDGTSIYVRPRRCLLHPYILCERTFVYSQSSF
jgi:hypothetical protein